MRNIFYVLCFMSFVLYSVKRISHIFSINVRCIQTAYLYFRNQNIGAVYLLLYVTSQIHRFEIKIFDISNLINTYYIIYTHCFSNRTFAAFISFYHFHISFRSWFKFFKIPCKNMSQRLYVYVFVVLCRFFMFHLKS